MTNVHEYASDILAPIVKRENYTFVGWSPEVDTTVPASNVTYTAQWQINQYSVAFDANGGVGSVTNELDYASDIIAPDVMREGYTFVGWLPEVDATVPASNVTYTAQWSISRPCSAVSPSRASGIMLSPVVVVLRTLQYRIA